MRFIFNLIKNQLSTVRNVVAFEPRKEFELGMAGLLKGGDYSLTLVSSLQELKKVSKKIEVSAVVVDSEVSVGDLGVFDLLPEFDACGLLSCVVYLVPRNANRRTIASLIAANPLHILTRASSPSGVQGSLNRVLIGQGNGSNGRRKALPDSLKGSFVNTSIEHDEKIIGKLDLLVEGYIFAAGEARKSGDLKRETHHLVSAFKLAPYSFDLMNSVLKRCCSDRSVYKVASMFLRNHPVTSRLLGVGGQLAIDKLPPTSNYRDKLNYIISQRLVASYTLYSSG